MEKNRQETFQRQTQAQYAAIGRCAVSFEHVCHAMVSTVLSLLHSQGLRNQRVANALLAGLTANPLRMIFHSVIAEVRGEKLQGDELRIVDNITKRIRDLAESRNDLIHRTWFVGWVAEDDNEFATVTGAKVRKNKEGVRFEAKEFSIDDFDRFSTEANELTQIINRLNGCYGFDFDVSKNFLIEGDGTVRTPAPIPKEHG